MNKLKYIDDTLIESTTQKANLSSRKRAHSPFHKFDDKIQRLLNVYNKGAYIPPHKHENPDKLEIFLCLKGKFLALSFDDQGEIVQHTFFGPNEKVKGIEVPPSTWHTFWSLEDSSIIYEIIEGPYDPATHKKFAPWAPTEKEENDALSYMTQIQKKLGYTI